MKKLMVIGSTVLVALSLVACGSSNTTKKQSKTSKVEQRLKSDAKQKQSLTEIQWNLENKRQYYVSKGDFSNLSKMSSAVFANQRAMTKINSNMDSLNQKLAKLSHKHKHVDNNGNVVYYPVIVPSYTATAATNNATTTTHAADEEETTAHTTETESTAHTTEAPEAHATVSAHGGE